MEKLKIIIMALLSFMIVSGCGENINLPPSADEPSGDGAGEKQTGAISFRIDFYSPAENKVLSAALYAAEPFSNVEYRQRVGLVDAGLVSSATGSLVSQGTFTVVNGTVSPTLTNIAAGDYILKIQGKTPRAGIGLYKGEAPVTVLANQTATPEISLNLDSPSVGVLASGLSGSFVSNGTYTSQVVSSVASGQTLTNDGSAVFDGTNMLFQAPLSLAPKTVRAVFTVTDADGKSYSRAEAVDILAVIDACEANGHHAIRFEAVPGTIAPIINFGDGGASSLSFLAASFYRESDLNSWDPVSRKIVIAQAGQDWQANLSWRPIPVIAGEAYKLSFTCTSPSQSAFNVAIKKDNGDYVQYAAQSAVCDGTPKNVILVSSGTDAAAQIVLNFGSNAGEYVFDENIALEKLI